MLYCRVMSKFIILFLFVKIFKKNYICYAKYLNPKTNIQMKKLTILLFAILSINIAFAQTSQEIAKVYLRKARVAFEKKDSKEALRLFSKATKLIPNVTSPEIAKLGTSIFFELKKYKAAKMYAKMYFAVEENKTSDEYLNLLEKYVDIEEKIEQEKVRIQKEKEMKLLTAARKAQMDSLQVIWNKKSLELSIAADTIYPFDKFGIAIFKNNDTFGIINENGEVIVPADKYKDYRSFDGFTLLLDKKQPSHIYCYNSSAKKGFDFLPIADFNPVSTTYGVVTLPRANARVVMYPNNSYRAIVYDLNANKYVVEDKLEEKFQRMKREDKIDKFDGDKVRINKVWYHCGGDIGSGIFPLFDDLYKLAGFFCYIDGRVITPSEIGHIGISYENKNQAIKDGKTFWIVANGTKVEKPENKSGRYNGDTHIVRVASNLFQIQKEIDGVTTILYNDKKLKNSAFFIKEELEHLPAITLESIREKMKATQPTTSQDTSVVE